MQQIRTELGALKGFRIAKVCVCRRGEAWPCCVCALLAPWLRVYYVVSELIRCLYMLWQEVCLKDSKSVSPRYAKLRVE